MTVNTPEEALLDILKGQSLAVLATEKEGRPYTNLIAFAATEDLKNILFVTPRFTRKYSNIQGSSYASIMVDNRSNTVSDFKDATVVNAMGIVKEVDKIPVFSDLYLSKQPHLEKFLKAPTSALMMMEVEKYIIATSFQNVVEMELK
ncbi:pyridoxamine 5'-phosphate oxidase [Methanococcoides methylutens]|uniref:Pyridoxamine 5'-phosphate oxidase n=1 Tax=Methanococcoides methylutens TaxID=2226 RepID=A0A099T6E3_METMT|nr:pyridoxamine 5'-phosphate oxidase family protein [Methanococcoides methylutens]KGK99708.1 pyridoxamine 5'-phosphate oxidase [Methanococcoides methylutens]